MACHYITKYEVLLDVGALRCEAPKGCETWRINAVHHVDQSTCYILVYVYILLLFVMLPLSSNKQ
jgi:hypothetical protein